RQLDGFPRLHCADPQRELLVVGQLTTVHRDNDVATLKAGALGGCARCHLFDDGRTARQIESVNQAGARRTIAHAQPPTLDSTRLDELGCHIPCGITGDGEANALKSAGPRDDGRIAADPFTARVYERPSRVTRIDGGIRLDEAMRGCRPRRSLTEARHESATLDASRCADDAGRHRVAQVST